MIVSSWYKLQRSIEKLGVCYAPQNSSDGREIDCLDCANCKDLYTSLELLGQVELEVERLLEEKYDEGRSDGLNDHYCSDY